MAISGFIKDFRGYLIPDSTLLANALTKAELWEQFVPYPVTDPYYTTRVYDVGTNETLHMQINIRSSNGRGVVGTPIISTSIDSWADGASDPNVYTAWSSGSLLIRYYKAKLVVDTSVPCIVKLFSVSAHN